MVLWSYRFLKSWYTLTHPRSFGEKKAMINSVSPQNSLIIIKVAFQKRQKLLIIIIIILLLLLLLLLLLFQ